MEKGQRVTIVRGRSGKDQSGVIFWKGPNKWGEGERLGVRSDSGETFWVSDQDVEVGGAPAPAAATHTFSKGDRVSFMTRGRESTGTVFWIGENRHGPGQRLGVRDDHPEGSDDAVWLDSRQALPHDGEAPQRTNHTSHSDHADDDGIPAAESYEMPPMDDGPPIDHYADVFIDMGEEEPPFDL